MLSLELYLSNVVHGKNCM